MTRASKSSPTVVRLQHGAVEGGRWRSLQGLGRMLMLVACIVASGLQVVLTTHELRTTHRHLQEARNQQDLLLAEHSRLLLERGALVAYQNIERVAAVELGMRFPDRVERIAP